MEILDTFIYFVIYSPESDAVAFAVLGCFLINEFLVRPLKRKSPR